MVQPPESVAVSGSVHHGPEPVSQCRTPRRADRQARGGEACQGVQVGKKRELSALPPQQMAETGGPQDAQDDIGEEVDVPGPERVAEKAGRERQQPGALFSVVRIAPLAE